MSSSMIDKKKIDFPTHILKPKDTVDMGKTMENGVNVSDIKFSGKNSHKRTSTGI